MIREFGLRYSGTLFIIAVLKLRNPLWQETSRFHDGLILFQFDTIGTKFDTLGI